MLEPEAGEEREADSGHDPAGAALALQSVGARHPHRVQRLHVAHRVERLFLHSPAVHHEHAVVNRDRSLSQVRGDNNLA